jgi:glucuronoarabinoxylan endo-1,4-beta-xylanase
MKSFKQVSIIFSIVMVMMIFFGQGDLLAATATIDTSVTYQTIEGFGASISWYYTSLYSHNKNSEIYNYLFNELGLNILRLRNIYGKSSEFSVLGAIVDSFYSYSDNDPKVLISSWSPPASLKSNNSTNNGGTLDTTATGEYVYGDFAQYWVDALNAFEAVGIVPEYISIQNEPDFVATWESCVFAPTETATLAGYDQALDSVYQRIQELASPPKILASEVAGIGYNTFQNFAGDFNHDYVDGYAYHLYNGGSENNTDPDAFITNLTTIATSYSGKPIFQTEYDYGGWFNTAWLMHNCLVYGNVSGYFYWSAVWGDGGNPFITMNGTTGYTVEPVYWAFRQYSKAIRSGWKRVDAEVVNGYYLRVSAYISPEKDELSIVILNLIADAYDLDLNLQGFDMTGARIIRTSNSEQGVLVDTYDGVSTLNIPGRSITTITTLDISGGVEDKIQTDFTLVQNYPNPFGATTTIRYSLNKPSEVILTIRNVAGQRVRTLQNTFQSAGVYSVVWDATDDNNRPVGPGVYFYQLEAGGKNIQKKMVLIR